MNKTKNNDIQLFRALAIIAVVCIHTCPLGLPQVFFRPFMNFAVALFVFLSGYLTRIENDNWPQFCKKRIIRVIIPYIIWITVYSLYDHIFKMGSISLLPRYLLTASVRAHLYYIPVYISLVLITPFMGKLIKSKYRHIVWLITPISYILFFYTKFTPQIQINPSIIKISGLLFFGWFSYYYLGILLGNNIIRIKWNQTALIALLFISFFLQMAEAYALYQLFDFTNCGTQGKLTPLLTNMIFLLLVYTYLSSKKKRTQYSFLYKIGDYSFGIYLCHVLFINISECSSFYSKIPYPITSLLILLLSLVFCYCCDKLFHSRITKYLGIK